MSVYKSIIINARGMHMLSQLRASRKDNDHPTLLIHHLYVILGLLSNSSASTPEQKGSVRGLETKREKNIDATYCPEGNTEAKK